MFIFSESIQNEIEVNILILLLICALVLDAKNIKSLFFRQRGIFPMPVDVFLFCCNLFLSFEYFLVVTCLERFSSF